MDPADYLILDFWPSEQGEYISAVSRHQVHDVTTTALGNGCSATGQILWRQVKIQHPPLPLEDGEGRVSKAKGGLL